MSESRVRENRMPGLTGGRWRSGSHGEPERCARRETGGTEPDHLPRADPPAAYLTGLNRIGWRWGLATSTRVAFCWKRDRKLGSARAQADTSAGGRLRVVAE